MDPKRQPQQDSASTRPASNDDALQDLPDQERDEASARGQGENVKGGQLPPSKRAALQ